jgi:DNA replication protein DnaC
MKSSTESLDHASVRQYCKAVRVPVIAANFLTLAEQAVKENHSHIHYLEALLAMESEERDRHAIQNRIRDAQLPRMKTLEEFDFGQAPRIPAARVRELAEGGYIERSEPVVFIGECGTGKTHLATGLCVAACRQKRRVRFTTAAALVNELVEAKQNNQVRRLMARWQRYELIAVDEVGYVPLADIGAEFLFQVISERAERAAIVVTTNLLCGAPHKRFNAESIFMRTPRLMDRARGHFAVFLLRILGAAFNISISLSVALNRPVRSFGAITNSRASSFTDGSARV